MTTLQLKNKILDNSGSFPPMFLALGGMIALPIVVITGEMLWFMIPIAGMLVGEFIDCKVNN